MSEITEYRITGETFDGWGDNEYRLREDSPCGKKRGGFDLSQLIDLGVLDKEEVGGFREEGEEITITIDFR